MFTVLLLCEYATLNGGEQSMLATLDGVREAGVTPSVLGPPRGPLADALHAKNIELLPFPSHDATGKRLSQQQHRDVLDRTLRDRRPDLLHANSLAMGRLSGPVARALRLPSIAHLRDIIGISRQATADLNCHTRLLAVSNATRAYHVARGLAAEKTHVLHNGVDLARFRPRKPTGYLHRELGLPPASLLIGTIGQIGLRKGQEVLATAAASLARQLPSAHYLFVGERHSQKEESRRFEADLRAAACGPLTGKFHFLGFRPDVADILNELALLVHPARQEPLGRVLLEAAATGVAVIATDVGGTQEIFPPQSESARLVAADDAEALANAMIDLLQDEPSRNAMAKAARRRAEEAFDIRTAVAGLVRHYREATE
ncbi:MAG: glycosyltransferase family 4 protein [Thermoguttaceae bacterium]